MICPACRHEIIDLPCVNCNYSPYSNKIIYEHDNYSKDIGIVTLTNKRFIPLCYAFIRSLRRFTDLPVEIITPDKSRIDLPNVIHIDYDFIPRISSESLICHLLQCDIPHLTRFKNYIYSDVDVYVNFDFTVLLDRVKSDKVVCLYRQKIHNNSQPKEWDMFNSGFYATYENSWLKEWRDHLPAVVSSQYRMNSLIYKLKPNNVFEISEDYLFALWINTQDKELGEKVYHLGSGLGIDVMLSIKHPAVEEYKKLLPENSLTK